MVTLMFQRQDMMSRTMSEDQYMKFHEARQINLGRLRFATSLAIAKHI